ncbi:RNA polymerase sigma factor [Chitinophaga sp. XS-30]|uniref:RNA polymerase sigma factor n=1 Tax=Chitinophaga sp. XS-30 TaxID=2604421 RepID=UPI0011DC7824|nr:sigma-70 family RNA polymerase sigma factor [Chitinophaga sp. XS-30]QEH40725.1 sigma-70 family RNA polymerase sigma factor [Chitinophaga sp. XS-30]
MSTNTSYNEKELLLRLEAGDKSAFDSLYYRFEPRVRLFLHPFAIGDTDMIDIVIQDVFVKLWLKRQELSGIATLEYYLQRMAKNRLLDILKLRNIRDRHKKNYAILQSTSTNNAKEELQLKEYLAIAREGMDKMPLRRRIIFSMNELDGFSIDEIATQMQISRDVVKKQLQKARAFLKEYISKHGDLPGAICLAILVLLEY